MSNMVNAWTEEEERLLVHCKRVLKMTYPEIEAAHVIPRRSPLAMRQRLRDLEGRRTIRPETCAESAWREACERASQLYHDAMTRAYANCARRVGMAG